LGAGMQADGESKKQNRSDHRFRWNGVAQHQTGLSNLRAIAVLYTVIGFYIGHKISKTPMIIFLILAHFMACFHTPQHVYQMRTDLRGGWCRA